MILGGGGYPNDARKADPAVLAAQGALAVLFDLAEGEGVVLMSIHPRAILLLGLAATSANAANEDSSSDDDGGANDKPGGRSSTSSACSLTGWISKLFPTWICDVYFS